MRCSQYDVLSINLLLNLLNQKLYVFYKFILFFWCCFVALLLWCFMFLRYRLESVPHSDRSAQPELVALERGRPAQGFTFQQRWDNVVTTQRYKATTLHVTRCHKSLVSLYLAKLTEATKSCSSTKSLAPPLKTCDRNSRNKWNKYKRITSDRVR